MADPSKGTIFLDLTSEIVSSFVANNTVIASELSPLIEAVHASLRRVAVGSIPSTASTPQKIAISIRKSVTPDYIVCLEDGLPFKSMKRHLRTAYGLSPDEYREKWQLGPTYPMIAPNYAAVRSELAKQPRRVRSRNEASVTESPDGIP